MRIGLISTNATPVRQFNSGSIEGLVWLLAREFTNAGHEVTVFASAPSDVPGRLVSVLPGQYARDGSPGDWQLCDWINLARAIECSEGLDILHSNVYLWAAPLERFSRAPMLHTTHMMPTADDAFVWRKAAHICVSAISAYQWRAFPEFSPVAVVHHGVDGSHFTFTSDSDEYLLFLGRLTEEKGVLQAIETAQAIGMKLVIAGPPNSFFYARVKPKIDGKDVEYAGSVTGEQRRDLLQRARALIYPISQPEPFGLVMAEAMMCGAPVAAFRVGAVSEIVDDGVTGYAVDSAPELGDAVHRCLSLDRSAVRARAVSRFSASRMAADYLQVYRKVANG